MSDNKYYEKIRKYARRALNSDFKTYIRGRDLYMYGTLDMSEYVKQEVFDDTVEELEKKIQDLDDKKANKSDVYTKDETDDKFLTKDEAAATYLPIGDYATVTYVDNADTLLLNQINLKQDQLTAGLGILIENNVISCTIDTTLYKVVKSLPDKPDEGDENKIFLVPSELQGDKNIYIEYLYVNGAWEKIGEIQTEVDLSNYYTKEEVIALLENYYTKEEVDKLIETATGGGITKIDAIGTSPLNLEADISGTSATITGSIDIANNDALGVVSVRDENGLHIIIDENASNCGEIYLTLVSTTENGAMSAEDKRRLDDLWEKYGDVTYSETLTIQTFEYNNGETIPATGGTYSPTLVVVYTKINDNTGEIVKEEVIVPDTTQYSIITGSTHNEGFSLQNASTGVLDVEASTRSTSASVDIQVGVTYTSDDRTILSKAKTTTVTRAGKDPEMEYELEITEFTYPGQSYSYEAHSNINATAVAVEFRTYEDGKLIDTEDVTGECEFEYEGNVDWITKSALIGPDSLLPIDIAENTGDTTRAGTVHLKATYRDYVAEADSNEVAQGLKPDEYTYALNVANFQYHTSAGTNMISADGCTNVSPDLAVLLMTINTSTGYTTGTQITPTSSYYEITNGGSIDSSTGVITISSNITTLSRTYTVTGEFKYLAPNGEELETSGSVILTQSASETTYSLEISSFSYNGGNNIPAEGGSFYPDLVVGLITTRGATSSTSRVTPNSTFYTIERSDFVDLENEGTGLATWDENPNSSSRNVVFNVEAWYTAPNGEELEAEGGGIIYQDGVDTVITYEKPQIDSLTYPSIPANGGTISPTITYHQDWSDNQGNSGTITNTGAEFNYWFIMSQVNCTVDKSTGDLTTSVVNSSANIVIAGDVQCFITMNGLDSSTHGITVYQEGAEKTTEYEKPIIDLLEYPTIPSNGGTVSPSKLTYHQDWKSNDGTSGTITNEGGTFTYSYVKDQVAGTINSSTGALTISTENSSTDMITAGSVSCAVTMNGLTSTNYNVDVYQQGDNPDDPETYYLAQGNLIVNSEATGISATDIDWENVSIGINSSNHTGTGLSDIILYRPWGESELLIGKFGSDIPLLSTSDTIELTKVAKLSMIGIAFLDPTLNLDDKQIKYTFKWHYDNNKTFERSGNLYLTNRGMGDAGTWTTDDYDQSDANLYYNVDYEMYPEVILTITD